MAEFFVLSFIYRVFIKYCVFFSRIPEHPVHIRIEGLKEKTLINKKAIDMID